MIELEIKMSDPTTQEKLQRAYHDMLENVEEFVGKESKSIREAIYKAEDKLGEWEELSKDEISNISDEVKRDLTSFADTFIGAKAAFKEQLELDKRYLAQATWDKLSSIADKSTLQLIQLKEELAENMLAVEQSRYDDPQYNEHHDHQQWHNEHALWLDDIAQWEKTNTEAKEKLENIKTLLNQQTLALEEHKQSIQSHEAIAKEHEHDLSLSSQQAHEQNENDEGKESREPDPIHVQENEKHQQQAAFHADIKDYHRQTLALINALHKEAQLFEKSSP